MGQKWSLTQHCEGGVGGDGARCVFGSAAVYAHVLRLDVHDEEHVVIGHDVHTTLPCSGEIRAAVLLPGDLRCRVALCGALEPRGVACPDGAVPGSLYEGWENCGQRSLRQCNLYETTSATMYSQGDCFSLFLKQFATCNVTHLIPLPTHSQLVPPFKP